MDDNIDTVRKVCGCDKDGEPVEEQLSWPTEVQVGCIILVLDTLQFLGQRLSTGTILRNRVCLRLCLTLAGDDASDRKGDEVGEKNDERRGVLQNGQETFRRLGLYRDRLHVDDKCS